MDFSTWELVDCPDSDLKDYVTITSDTRLSHVTSGRTLFSSASASTSPPTRWDVFLNYNVIDAQYTFTDPLYIALDCHGVHTYCDNFYIRVGELISRELRQAIRESKIYIVVFSENYASSPWCLDELVEILNCHITTGRKIVPVFYNIEQWTVRDQTESFEQAFKKHQIRFKGEMEKVNKWRLTLKEVAEISGYQISGNR